MTMEQAHERQAGHSYGSIHVSGNARVIIGNVYGLGDDFLESATQVIAKSEMLEDLQNLPELPTVDNSAILTSKLASLVLREFGTVRKNASKARYHEIQLRKIADRISVKREIVKGIILCMIDGYSNLQVGEAGQMLKKPSHPTWTDVGFLTYLDNRLGDNRIAVSKVLELISLDMDALASFLYKCNEKFDKSEQMAIVQASFHNGRPDVSIVNTECKQTYQMRDQAARGLIRPKKVVIDPPSETVRKVQLTELLDDSCLSEHMLSLKDNITDLRALLDQSSLRQQSSPVNTPTMETKLKLGRFRTIREAASDLHRSFTRACTEHTTHQARLRIQADNADSQQVKFSLILEQSRSQLSELHDAPVLQLTIQSELTGSITSADSTDLTRTAASGSKSLGKRVCDPDVEVKEVPTVRLKASRGKDQGRKKKCVGFATVLHPPPSMQQSSYPNFCTHSDFCIHVKQLLREGCHENHPLGYLDLPGCSKHLIYLESYTLTQTLIYTPTITQRPESFAQLYACQIKKLSKADTLSLAKQLAIGLLQYYATPWLEASWDGDHILVERKPLGSNRSENSSYRTCDPFDPYLDVSVNSPSCSKQTPTQDRSRTLIREWDLFSLGVMLIELAYRQPIKNKQIERDIDSNEHNTSYYTAERLQRSVAEEMGPVYAEIIRKCIQCDFGHGADLGTTKLQESFYENVVQKLENLQKKFSELGV